MQPTQPIWLLLLIFLASSWLMHAQVDTVSLRITQAPAFRADTTAVPVAIIADSLTEIAALQFSVNWNTEELTFDRIELGANPLELLSNSYSVKDTGTIALLKVADFDTDGSFQVAPGDTLFQLYFIPQKTEGFAAIDFSGFLEPEFTSGGTFQTRPFRLTTGGIQLYEAVYPGDTNADGVVSVDDLLNIGLAFGATGPVRPFSSVEWAKQYAIAWKDSLPESQLDLYHVDANGDGRIDSLDLEVVRANLFSVRSEWSEARPTGEARTSGAQLVFDTIQLQAGQITGVPLMVGTDIAPIDSIYGIRFSVRYPPGNLDPRSLFFDSSDSWLGTNNTSIIGIQAHYPDQNRLDVALSRTDQQALTGFGELGKLYLEPSSSSATEPARIVLQTRDIQVVSPHEIYDSLTTAEQELIVTSETTSVIEPIWAKELKLFPNPTTNGRITIQHPSPAFTAIELRAPDGRLIQWYTPSDRVLELSGLPAGIYYLRILHQQEWITRPISLSTP